MEDIVDFLLSQPGIRLQAEINKPEKIQVLRQDETTAATILLGQSIDQLFEKAAMPLSSRLTPIYYLTDAESVQYHLEDRKSGSREHLIKWLEMKHKGREYRIDVNGNNIDITCKILRDDKTIAVQYTIPIALYHALKVESANKRDQRIPVAYTILNSNLRDYELAQLYGSRNTGPVLRHGEDYPLSAGRKPLSRPITREAVAGTR